MSVPSPPPAAVPTQRVAYLVSRYPGLSHTFIEREVLALRAAGIDVHTFSVRPCPPAELLSGTMRTEATRTTVLLGSPARAWFRAHAGLLRRRPGAWLSTLGRALRTGEPSPKARLWQVFYFAEAVLLHDELVRRGIRALHVHFANVSSDVARLTIDLGRRIDGPQAGWRWTMTMHGPTEFEAVARFDLAAKTRDAAAVACISDFCRSQLMRLVPPDEWPKLRLVRMSVDVDRYAPQSEETRDPTAHGPLRLLYVGRLVPEKGGPVLLDAIERLSAAGVAVDLRIVGSGPLAQDLAAQVARAGLGDVVQLVGPKGQDELPDLYAWADVFVLPSFQEGLPVVLMEALASGVPVVTTRIAGIPELVVDGQMGRVVAPGRVDELADAISELAADPVARARMGARGRAAVVAEFTPQAAAAAMIDDILAPSARASSDAPARDRIGSEG